MHEEDREKNSELVDEDFLNSKTAVSGRMSNHSRLKDDANE